MGSRQEPSARASQLRRFTVMLDLLHEEVLERLVARIHRHQPGPAADQLAEYLFRRPSARQLESVPTIGDAGDAAHVRTEVGHRGWRHARDDELPSLDVPGQIRQPAAGHQPATHDDRHATAEGLGIGENMRAEKDGSTLISQRKNQLPHVSSTERVEVRTSARPGK